MTRKSFDRSIGIAFLGFIFLGLPDGLLGLAWPSIQAEFNLAPSALGAFFLASTTGFILTSLFSGVLSRRLGIRQLLIGAYSLRGLALIGVFFAPSWEVIILLGLIAGFGDGGIDTGLNVYVAGYDNPRLMNYLHAFFGVGAALGPLLMVALFSAGISWSVGFLLVGALKGLMVALLLLVPLTEVSITQEENETAASFTNTLRMPMVWMGVFAFSLCAGLEVSANQWSYTLFTEGRGIEPAAAGLWVSAYRATFTLGRFFFGFLGDRLPTSVQLRGSLLLSIFSCFLVWWNPVQAVGTVGLVLLGVAIAPQFPLLMAETVRRVGLRHAANAIGLQMGGASLGVGVLPGLTGWFIERHEVSVLPIFTRNIPLNTAALTYNPALEVVTVIFIVIALLLFILHEIMLFWVRRPAHIKFSQSKQPVRMNT